MARSRINMLSFSWNVSEAAEPGQKKRVWERGKGERGERGRRGSSRPQRALGRETPPPSYCSPFHSPYCTLRRPGFRRGPHRVSKSPARTAGGTKLRATAHVSAAAARRDGETPLSGCLGPRTRGGRGQGAGRGGGTVPRATRSPRDRFRQRPRAAPARLPRATWARLAGRGRGRGSVRRAGRARAFREKAPAASGRAALLMRSLAGGRILTLLAHVEDRRGALPGYLTLEHPERGGASVEAQVVLPRRHVSAPQSWTAALQQWLEARCISACRRGAFVFAPARPRTRGPPLRRGADGRARRQARCRARRSV